MKAYPEWDEMKGLVEELVQQVYGYYERITGNNPLVFKSHNALRPSCPVRGRNYATLPPQEVLKTEFDIPIEKASLLAKLKYMEPYEPVLLNDGFLPSENKAKHECTRSFPMPFPVTVFYFHIPGPHPTQWYIWRLDSAEYAEAYPDARSEEVIAGLQAPKFQTRAQQRQFMADAELITKTSRMDPSKKTFKQLFHLFTGDDAKRSQHTEELESKLQQMLDISTGDYEFAQEMVDEKILKALTQFDEFWDKTAEMLTAITATASRRETATLHIDPSATQHDKPDQPEEQPKSRELRDFYQDIIDALPIGTPMPKYKWFKYQFNPVNSLRRAALKHTGRVQVAIPPQP